ncbi:MAG: hypothetical protein HYX68_01350 [Planctomycetes bacterium]|nr:hypothetical protein [Planctomycetota bacterium]
MRRKIQLRNRRGAIVPLVAICLVALLGMVALAIDIGMVAVAKTQAQNAADSAAMVGTRTFNQQAGYNLSNVPKTAITAAQANKIFNAAITTDPNAITNPSADIYTSGQVTIECGGYYYVYDDNNAAAEGFQIKIPNKISTEPYTAVRATINSTSPIFFGSVFGAKPFNVKATAVAAHRPRDVIIIMDLSGSMRFQSLPGINVNSGTASPSSSSRARNKSMNPDPDYPRFGPYSDTTGAALWGNSSYSTGAEWCDPSNISYTTISGPPIAADFMSSGSTLAFTRGAASFSTTPGGDDYPKYGGSYVVTAAGFLNNATDETTLRNFLKNGMGTSFNGYTEGPSYWGKTFFVWPPDPRGSDLNANTTSNHANNGAKDWRQRFFFKQNTATNTLYWLDHNNILFNPSGAPMTNTSTTTPIMRDPDTSVSVTERGASVSYRLRINYAAILTWLKQTPVHFPTQLNSGRIKYYDAIPDGSDTGLNSRWWSGSGLTNDEKFWKAYIDFMLGYVANGSSYSATNGSNVPNTALIGNGDFWKWGSTAIKVSQRPDCNHHGLINKSGGYSSGATTIVVDNVKTTGGTTTTPTVGNFVRINYGSTIYKVTAVSTSSGNSTLTLDTGLAVSCADNDIVQFYTAVPRYMDHADNPYRPRHQFWFGPLSFIDWLGNYNTPQFWWPGNVHEAQAWACKVGISSAIDDIKNNHPNDYVGMTFFSSPKTSAGGSGQHNQAVVPLGRDYQKLKDSLWFPPTTVVGSVSYITPYDSDMANVPRANGGTCPGMGFMIAYNLFSSSVSNLRNYAQPSGTYRGYAGGLGRKGAERLIIFETDGAPNTGGFATIQGTGSNSYYKIRMKYPTNVSDSSNEFPSGGTYADNDVYNVVKQICAMTTDTTPGYSTTRKKAKVYSLGYGSFFDPTNSSAGQTDALDFLQTVQYYGNVATSTSGASFPDWQRIYGDTTTRQNRMRDAFTKIMQAGVQVSLLE